jgi:hypothetical protein
MSGKIMRKVLFFFILFFASFEIFSIDKNQILSFSPEGEVKDVTQVKVVFGSQMVPFGNPRTKTDQFEIDCPVTGKARWIDEKIFVYEFIESLKAGINCTFKLKNDIKTLSGSEITGKKLFKFTTGGPTVLSMNPYSDSGIDEDQIFILNLDSEIDIKTLQGNLYFEIQGLKEKIPAEVLDKNSSEVKEIYKSLYSKPQPTDLVLRASKKFPFNGKVSLVWSTGINSKTGVPNSTQQVFNYTVRKPFTAEMSCERENAKSNCIPFSKIYIHLSAPILSKHISKISLKGKDKTYTAKYKNSDSEAEEDTVSTIYFEGPFPEESSFSLNISSDLEDDSKRKLSNAKKFPLLVKTDRFPPLAKFSGDFGILELEADPVLPVTLRNLDKTVNSKIITLSKDADNLLNKIFGKKVKITPEGILTWLKKISNSKREKSIFQNVNDANKFEIPKPNGERAFEVVGIPLKEPGFYALEIESEKLGASLLEKKGKLYVPTSALVTNLAVHFKMGNENSLVWVTTLDKAQVVMDAKVSIRDCKNNLLGEGTTSVNGIWSFNGKLNPANCGYGEYDTGVLVIAEKGKDLSFVHSNWTRGIEQWRFNLSGGMFPNNTIHHTILDRTVFRAGETVHMKHLVRKHSTSGLNFAPNSNLPTKVKISFHAQNKEYFLPLNWNNGSAESIWKIPKEVSLGNYSISLVKDSNESYTGEFYVSEFKVPTLKAILQGPVEKLVQAKKITVDMIVNYLAGGPASGLPVKLTAIQRDSYLPNLPDWEDYIFVSKKLVEGKTKSNYEYEDSEETNNVVGNTQTKELVLDKIGTAKQDLELKQNSETIQELYVEMEYRDPMGEIQTSANRFKIYPSKYLVGLRSDSWSMPQDDLKAVAAVIDLDGKAKSSVSVEISMFKRNYISNRKRLVGGFYSYDSYTEIKKVGTFCSGKTDDKGIFSCKKNSPVGGNIILQAEITDPNGNKSYSTKEYYLSGKETYFDVSDNDRIDIIPDKKSYDPGESAKIQVRMPFKKGTALVTVEREGILDQYIREISSAQPFVEVPIKKNYTPNVYVSVLVVRGRVGEVKPTALVDLGKPSFKLGIVPLKIGWSANELKVTVKTDRPVYKIREKALASIKVKTSDGTSLPKNSEIALAAIDEGLLELMENRSWDILSVMMNQRGLDVNTSTAQMQVVGRRHYGIKALPAGGGGGADSAREFFDTLLLWKTTVKLDSEGNAEVSVPLNDSFSSFRIVALATAGEKYFGTGYTSIKTTKDLMLFSGVPQIGREGDKLNPSFTLKNSTNKNMDIDLNLSITGIPKLENKKVSLSANSSTEIFWEIEIPNQVEKLEYEIFAKAENGVSDRLKITQKIFPSMPIRVLQGTLLQLDSEHKVEIDSLKEIEDRRGSIEVHYSKSLLDNLNSIKEYMNQYPYTCFEQQASKIIVDRNKANWNKLMNSLPSYLDSDGFIKYFPSMDYGSPSLTSYILSIAHEADLAIPEETKNILLNSLSNFVDGKIYRESSVPTADLTLRKLSALEALSRYNRLKLDTLTSLNLTITILPTSALIDWWNILYKNPNIPKRNESINQVEQILLSRMNLQGTSMKFTTESSDSLWWLMTSPDTNAVRMVLTLVNLKKWKDDMGRILRGTLNRQKKGVWDLTTSNAWGVLALEKFSKEFEKETITGETFSSLSNKEEKTDWSKVKNKDSKKFPLPDKNSDLKIKHTGTGKPWVNIISKGALPIKTSVSNGYTIEKIWKPTESKILDIFSNSYKRNDLIKVTLKIKADQDMSWVVINDPIPTGSAILGGIRKDSMLQDQKSSETAYPSFEERSYESYRAYFEYLPQGETILEYTIRLNQDGKFSLPPTRVEAMYSPDIYGETPNPKIEVSR